MYDSTTSASSSSSSPASSFLGLAIGVLSIVAIWRIFTKAGRPGWAALIPFYNVYVLLKIVGRPSWWLLLFLVPLVNLIIAIIVAVDLAKAFGRSALFGVVGLFFFSVIGYCILAFGHDQYVGPESGNDMSGTTPPTPPSTPTPPVMPAPPTTPAA